MSYYNGKSKRVFDFLILGRHLPEDNYYPRPYILLEKLESRNYSLTRSSHANCILSFDFDPKSEAILVQARELRIPRILIREETDAVYPLQYTKQIEAMFSKVINVGGISGRMNGATLRFPYTIAHHNHKYQEKLELKSIIGENSILGCYKFPNWNRRNNLIAFVGANKIIADNFMYNLRRKVIHSLQEELLLFGDYWEKISLRKFRFLMGYVSNSCRSRNRIDFRNVMGFLKANAQVNEARLDNKMEVMLNSKFSLVFENSLNHVTEKLWDSLVCGSIPIYFGDSSSFKDNLRELMIIPDYRLPIGALKSQIMNEISKCQSERLTRIESFLLSQEFEKEWTADGVYNKVVKEIEEFLPYLGNKYRN